MLFFFFLPLMSVVYKMCSTNLSSPVEFVGEFDSAEGHWSFHPVRSEVWGVGVHVHTAGGARLGSASRHPLSVHILPAVRVRRREVQQERVHGARVQTGHTHFQHGEHAPVYAPTNTRHARAL